MRTLVPGSGNLLEGRRRAGALEQTLNALIGEPLDLTLELETYGADQPDGALAGVTVTLKDVIDLAGALTTNGAAFPAVSPREDSEVARRLRAAGAVFVGKANLHEFAYGGTTQNPHFGSCRNPWDVTRIPGGSSGGSAVAVAAGYCDLSLGTDTAGSGRLPAALTGTCGLRPTLGRISLRGVTPLSPFLDTVSPIARTVEMVVRGYGAIAGYDPGDPFSEDRPVETVTADAADLEGCRIGVARGAYFDEIEPDVAATVKAAIAELTALGAQCVDVEIPDIDAARANLETLLHSDARAVHADRLAASPELFGADIRERLEALGGAMTAVQYSAARHWGVLWRKRLEPLLNSVDVIVHPGCPTTAPRVADCVKTTSATRRLAHFCYPWSLAGGPSMSVPCGFDTQGLPCGLMLVAKPWREADLFRVGLAYQRATRWHARDIGAELMEALAQ